MRPAEPCRALSRARVSTDPSSRSAGDTTAEEGSGEDDACGVGSACGVGRTTRRPLAGRDCSAAASSAWRSAARDSAPLRGGGSAATVSLSASVSAAPGGGCSTKKDCSEAERSSTLAQRKPAIDMLGFEYFQNWKPGTGFLPADSSPGDQRSSAHPFHTKLPNSGRLERGPGAWPRFGTGQEETKIDVFECGYQYSYFIHFRTRCDARWL
jgi:hypothetical protein